MLLPVPGLTVTALIAVNCVPIFGVIFLGWDIFLILAAYWIENVVIAFYNVLRMHCIDSPLKFSPGKAFVVVFFLVHYGGFTYLHGVCLLLIFGPSAPPADDLATSLSAIWPEVSQMLAARGHALVAMAVGLFASHGLSFVVNYLLRGERHRIQFNTLMFSPYRRVLVMHLTVVFGGILVELFPSYQGPLCGLVALKTGLDVFAHYREHRKPTEE
jgi:hypothetical protein